MSINPVVERHLKEALSELRSQRQELDAAIEEVVGTLRRLGGTVADDAAAAPAPVIPSGAAEERDEARPVTSAIAPPMKDAVLEYMDLMGGDVTTEMVVDALAEKYDWKPASLRSLMSRLKKDGLLGNPRRGVYNLDPSTTPSTSEAPGDEPGVSDEDATAMAQGGDLLDDAAPHQVDPTSGRSSAGQPDDRASIVR